MAMMKCPECGKEISDRAVYCPNCGCPIECHDESYSIVPSNNLKENDNKSDVKSRFKFENLFEFKDKFTKNINKILNNKKKVIRLGIIIASIFLIIIGISIYKSKINAEKYNSAMIYENSGEYEKAIEIYKDLGNYKDSETCGDYCQALSLCEKGNYKSAYSILMNIKDYEKTSTLLKQIYYETRLFEGLNDLKLYMKNPDSLTLKSVAFYYSKSTDTGSVCTIDNPACVIFSAGQNGFGGYSSSYSLCTNNNDKDSYQYVGSCNSLNASDYNLSNKNEKVKWVICKVINLHKKTMEIVNAVDMDRVSAIIESGKYGDIERIPIQSTENFLDDIDNVDKNESLEKKS